jgi:isocitrate dehydrogenase
MHNITLIKGDGIGPSIMDVAVQIIDASGVDINWEEADAGMAAYEKYGTALPDDLLFGQVMLQPHIKPFGILPNHNDINIFEFALRPFP